MASVPSAPTASAPPAPPTLDSTSSHHQHHGQQQDPITEAIVWLRNQGKDPESCVKEYRSQDQSGYTTRVQTLASLPEAVLHAFVKILRPNTPPQPLFPWAPQSSLLITTQSAGPRPPDNVIQPTPSRTVSGGIREPTNPTHSLLDENVAFGRPFPHLTSYGGASSLTGWLNDPSNLGGTPVPAFLAATSSSQWEPQLQPNPATLPIPRNMRPAGVDNLTTQSYSTSMPRMPMPMQENNNLGGYSHANNGILPSSDLAEPSANAGPVPKGGEKRIYTPRVCCGDAWACNKESPRDKRNRNGRHLWNITDWWRHYKEDHLKKRTDGWLHCTHCTVKYQGPESEDGLRNHIWDDHMCKPNPSSQSSPISNNSPPVPNVLSSHSLWDPDSGVSQYQNYL